MPSAYEGQPMVALEALGREPPVCASDRVQGLPDTVVQASTAMSMRGYRLSEVLECSESSEFVKSVASHAVDEVQNSGLRSTIHSDSNRCYINASPKLTSQGWSLRTLGLRRALTVCSMCAAETVCMEILLSGQGKPRPRRPACGLGDRFQTRAVLTQGIRCV